MVPLKRKINHLFSQFRFHGSPPLPRFRPPPPPNGQRNSRPGKGVEITEMGGDSISDTEDHANDNMTATQHRQRNVTKPPKKHFIHHNNQVIVEDIPNDMDFNKKYKTLDPTYKIRSHHMDSIPNYNSLERGTRRRLPDVPTHSTPIHHGFNTQSLPRPPKHHHREQSDSRSRERYAECQLISKEFNSV